MHHNVIGKEKRSFIIKICFFLVLLLIVGLMYFESKRSMDLAYFVVILSLFLRFLVVKLYH